MEKKVDLFPWNSFSEVPILATVHGTSGPSAWKICQGGFAALSSLDSGYYGAGKWFFVGAQNETLTESNPNFICLGIYFTTSARYAIPYYGTKPDPSIIISYVITYVPFTFHLFSSPLHLSNLFLAETPIPS